MMRRLLKPVVDLREHETVTAVLMFTYSFLAMTAYNIIKPATRSTFISGLGADNLPWVQLVAGTHAERQPVQLQQPLRRRGVRGHGVGGRDVH